MILDDFMTPDVLKDTYNFSPSGKYSSIPVTNKEGYLNYIKSLDLVPQPEVFGFHENALISCNVEESDGLFATLTTLLPKNVSGSGRTQDEITQDLAKEILKKTPDIIDINELQKQYPTMYEESMNTVFT
eukprot:UN11365